MSERTQEVVDKEKDQADIIFTAVTTSSLKDFTEAKQAVVMLYVPDMSFSRGAISLALGKLEKHYKHEESK